MRPGAWSGARVLRASVAIVWRSRRCPAVLPCGTPRTLAARCSSSRIQNGVRFWRARTRASLTICDRNSRGCVRECGDDARHGDSIGPGVRGYTLKCSLVEPTTLEEIVKLALRGAVEERGELL